MPVHQLRPRPDQTREENGTGAIEESHAPPTAQPDDTGLDIAAVSTGMAVLLRLTLRVMRGEGYASGNQPFPKKRSKLR
jgi:hypothetical protein